MSNPIESEEERTARIGRHLAYRVLPDGRECGVVPQLFNCKLFIGPIGALTMDDAWEYESPVTALSAFAAWDPATEPEPTGWTRHPATGRRRPDGDATREYVRP